MDVTKVLSKNNLLALSISDLTCISCRCFWRMSLEEVDHPLRFVLSLGCNLRNSMGFFWKLND